MKFSVLQKLSDLDLDLGSSRGHNVRISGRGLRAYQIRSKSEKKLSVDGSTYVRRLRTDGRIHLTSKSISSSPGNDVKIRDENLNVRN